ncbi:GNAT family N-acetyltransferase [Pseudoxanthomonas dokdonensis]|uniref:AttT protein n=1 Tax=Pseudoxanthomonas dokdonensis TaxID=344882 RepID=A0A0R0CF44_9GAMM|nr:GNAT family N-acetyltransferase [Pseudoxanthomonas dokdonensis]KRG68409.1 AttT protein [Pseudoxanthomonas dokdonensis]
MSATGSRYTVAYSIPSVETYRRLRLAAGLSAKTVAAAERGLPNTLFGVQILCGDEPVGMGRVIGDGGTFYQVVDIAVLPEHQGRGVGKRIMEEIAGYIAREVPESGYVSLLADGEAYRLYQHFGFALTAPASVGMALLKGAGTRS